MFLQMYQLTSRSALRAVATLLLSVFSAPIRASTLWLEPNSLRQLECVFS